MSIACEALLKFEDALRIVNAVIDGGNEQEYLQLTSLSLSILDPISQKRLVCPVRGVKCKHLQCFDWETYKEFNAKLPRVS
eukprot:9487387-Pyramimonas_sp.AAC.1